MTEVVDSLVDATDGLIELSKVHAYWKVIEGKLVHVKEYENKVEKQVHHHYDNTPGVDGAVTYKIPGHGEIHVTPSTKVFKTGNGHHVVIQDGKAFTLKKDGDIVPTAKAMKDKAEAGELKTVYPVQSAVNAPAEKPKAADFPIGTIYDKPGSGGGGFWKKTGADEWTGYHSHGTPVPWGGAKGGYVINTDDAMDGFIDSWTQFLPGTHKFNSEATVQIFGKPYALQSDDTGVWRYENGLIGEVFAVQHKDGSWTIYGGPESGGQTYFAGEAPAQAWDTHVKEGTAQKIWPPTEEKPSGHVSYEYKFGTALIPAGWLAWHNKPNTIVVAFDPDSPPNAKPLKWKWTVLHPDGTDTGTSYDSLEEATAAYNKSWVPIKTDTPNAAAPESKPALPHEEPPSDLPTSFQVPGHGKVSLYGTQKLYKTATGNHVLVSDEGEPILLHHLGSKGKPSKGVLGALSAGTYPLVAAAKPSSPKPAKKAAAKAEEKDVWSLPSGKFSTEDEVAQRTKDIYEHLKKNLAAQSSYYNPKGQADWNTISTKEKAERLATDDMVTWLKQQISDLLQVAKMPVDDSWNGPKAGHITKSVKQQTGKVRSRLETLLRAAELVRDIKTGTTKEHYQEEYNFLSTKMSWSKANTTFGKDFPVDVSAMLEGITQNWQHAEFLKKIEPLGWNPDTADVATLTDYANNHGFPYAAGLSDDDLRLWVKLDLGDPVALNQHSLAFKNSLQEKASFTLAKAQIVSLYKKKLDEAKTTEAQKKLPENVSALEASFMAKKKKLVKKYIANNPDDYSGDPPWVVEWMGDVDDYKDTPWVEFDEYGDEVGLHTDQWMIEKADLEHYVPEENSPHVYTPKPTKTNNVNLDEQWTSFEASNPLPKLMSTSQLNTYIKNNGGNYVGKMDSATKQWWIKFHLMGDNVAKYNIEATAAQKSNVGAGVQHKLAHTHPGSPDSVAGKKSRQALADILGQTLWGQKVLSKCQGKSTSALTEEERDAAFEGLNAIGLVAYYKPGLKPSEVGSLQKNAAINRWVHHHMGLPNASTSFIPEAPEDLTVEKPVVAKPSATTMEDWHFLSALENLHEPDLLKDISVDFGTMSPADVKAKINDDYYLKAGSYGFTVKDVADAPLDIQRLYLWFTNAYNAKNEHASLWTGLTTKLQAHYYVDKSQGQPNFVIGNTSIPLGPGDKVYQKGGDPGTLIQTVVLHANGAADHYPDSSGAPSTTGYATSPANLKADGYKLVAHGGHPPKKVTLEDVQQFWQATQYDWKAVEAYEAMSPDSISLPLSPSITDDGMLDTYIKENWPSALPPSIPAPSYVTLNAMPLGMRKVLAYAVDNDYDIAAIVGLKANQGYYSATKKAEIDPNAPYAQYVANGWTDEHHIQYNWPPSYKKAFAADHGLTFGNAGPSSALANKAIADFLAGTVATKTDPGTVDTTSTELVLTPKKNAQKLGGMHSKTVWVDQHGADWMVKAFPSDPNGPLRVDVEHVANLIGRLFGTKAPETRAMDLQGKYSYVQKLAPAKGEIRGKSFDQLTDDQIVQAMSEHVIDWILSNHDTHPGNLLISEDGKNIIPIDKGQAFKFFPNDKLAVGYLPPGNGEAVWYDQFYYAVQQGTIDKERADKIVARVLLKAKQVSTKNDARFRELLEEGLKSRTSWPQEYPNKEAFINALMERKHNLYDDFEKFYKNDVYAHSPYSFDVDITPLLAAKINDDIHVGVTPELIDEVHKAKVHGKALFFATKDLEDGYFLLHTEKAVDGSTTMKGEAKTLKDADATLTAWLKAQTITTDSGQKTSFGGTTSTGMLSTVNPASVLPNNDAWFGAIVAAAKTVNTHVSDGAYNEGTLNNLTSTVTQMTSALENSKVSKPLAGGKIQVTGVGTFEDADHLKAWQEMTQNYINYAHEIATAKSNSQKCPNKYFAYSYTPKAKAKIDQEFSSGDAPYTLQKLSDGTWKQVMNASGEVYDISDKDAQDLIKADGLSESSSMAVSAGTKTLTVVKRKSTATEGKYDPKEGTLVHSGSDLASGQHGYEYDIEYDNVRIEYRPWTEPGIPKSQQGLLRFAIKSHGGDTESVEEVFDVLRTMGLDLTPADEQSMELLYWRMLSGTVGLRADKSSNKVITDAITKANTTPNMSPDEELDLLKGAWAQKIGQDKVDNADYLPKFSHFAIKESDMTSGRPQWLRPDMTVADLKKYYGTKMLKMSLHGSSDSAHLADFVKSGGMYSTEERTRVLGAWITKESSESDQSHGSAHYIFTRQNLTSGQGSLHSSTDPEVWLMPHVALRHSNFSFASDSFGNIDSRTSESYFDPAQMYKYGGSSNEMMVKNGVSFLDDIAVIKVQTANHRTTVIKAFKDEGVTELHGVPIEDLVVTTNDAANKTVAKMWDAALKEAAK